MKKSRTINVQEWMCTYETRAVIELLNNGQAKPYALFVGGCVRNALLGMQVHDIDIATRHTPQQIMDLCKGSDIKTIPTGIDHGTLTLVINNKSYEVTTLRKDVETDGRRATIKFSDSWAEDAQRRDFTMNTLLADCEGNIYDPLGQGTDDLENRKVIFVGNAKTRIAEDVLRILRFFRFHAYYGAGEPDAEAIKACVSAANKISELSRERITQEMLKILILSNPCPILRLMHKHGIIRLWQYSDIEMLESLCVQQVSYEAIDLAARLLCLGELDSMSYMLLLPKSIKAQAAHIKAAIKAFPQIETDHDIQTMIYKYGREVTMQVVLKAKAKNKIAATLAKDFHRVISVVKTWDIPQFKTTGQDLLGQGYKPGPELGKELKRLEQKWIEGGFQPI